MSSQHQYGLLPCNLQGGVNHETTAKRPGLVRINRLFNALDIHMPDPEPPMRRGCRFAGSPFFLLTGKKNRTTGGQNAFTYLQHGFNESQVTLTPFIHRNTLSSV